MALIVLREVAVVYLGDIEGNEPFVDRFLGQLAIRFLEPLSDLTKARGTVLVVDAVVGNTVDEKEREDFDALAFERTFLLKVLLHGLVDLRPHEVVAQTADLLPKPKEAALIELDVFRAQRAVDVLHDVAVPINVTLA